MLSGLNWSQPDGIYVRSAGRRAAPDLNNLPKNVPITAPNPGCLARLLLARLHGAAKPRGCLAKALQD